MEIKIFHENSGYASALRITADPNERDVEHYSSKKAGLGEKEVIFPLDDPRLFSNTHPDLLALVGILCFGAFAHKQINFNFCVSEGFAEIVRTHLKKRIGPIDKKLERRSIRAGARDSLAFSGGVDSCAALHLLPKDTVPFFMHRFHPTNIAQGKYRADAALASCDAVRKSGYDVRAIRTSVEYARNPVGFPVDWSNAAPIVLYSDYMNLKSISFGMIGEAAYYWGHDRFIDLSPRSMIVAWRPLFDYLHLPINLPTAGLSEVVTTKIVCEKVPHWKAQSCVRGAVDNPCMRCYKCFRKLLLEGVISKKPIKRDFFDMAYNDKSIAKHLMGKPIHLENILAYCLLRLEPVDHPIYKALKLKTDGLIRYANGLGFMERYYLPNMPQVSDHLQEHMLMKLNEVSSPMTAEDEQLIQNWNLSDLLQAPEYLEGQKLMENEFGIDSSVQSIPA